MKPLSTAFLFALPAVAASAPAMAQADGIPADPTAFCRNVENLDEPGLSDGGPRALAWVRSHLGLRRGQAAMVAWRCMDGHVVACVDGGGSAGCDKGSARRAATPAMQNFCAAHPGEALPVAVTGADTIFNWTCAGGTPRIERQWAWLDRRGYIATDWRLLTPGRY